MINQINNDEAYELLEITNDDLSIPKKGEKTYRLANIFRVMFARLFDLLFSAIPGMVISQVILNKQQYVGNWTILGSILGASFVWILIYFVFIPFFTKGQTIGKLIFGIRLKRKGENKKISLWMLLARESYFNIIPWIILVVAQIISTVIMSKYQFDDSTKTRAPGLITASLIVNIANIVYVLWMVFISVTILIQNEHQASVDLKLNLFVVNKKAVEDEVKIHHHRNEVLQRTDEHVSLKDQPGNFDKKVIDDLYVSEDDEIKESINVEKPDFVEDLLIEKKRKDLIEQKNERDKKDDK